MMATQRLKEMEVRDDDKGASEHVENKSKSLMSLKKDQWNIALLLLLYTLQGIPLGLAGSIPMVLQAKKIGYRQQAIFSFVSWPFSVKLLWAPVVDAFYSRTIGRRKSWLIPVQFLIGVTMIVMSYYINTLLGEDGSAPSVYLLTVLFFLLFVCAATQDIAVDGWAITMLSRENVGHASTCNSVGQTVGYFLGYTIFLALESKEFCNTYIRSEPLESGIVDLPSFLFFWGIVFICVTSLVLIFKRERREAHEEVKSGIFSAYMKLLSILKLRPVQIYAVFLLTAKLGFAAAENVTGLKLVEAGLPRERIALLALPMVPIQVLLPVFISRMITGPRPLDVFISGYPFRLCLGLIFAAIVWWTSLIAMDTSEDFPLYYYIVLVVVFLVHQAATYSMFVATMSFNAQVSDPVIGGTYMTLLNTLSNLGGTWTGTVALWLVDIVSFKGCEGVTDLSLDCDTMAELEECKAAGGHCVTHLDGYYVEVIVCVAIGFAWFLWQRSKVNLLQSVDKSQWHVQHEHISQH